MAEGRRPLEGLHIGILGDVKHSRVARSNVQAFQALGATVTLVAPRTLLPPERGRVGDPASQVTTDLDDVLPKLDVAYVLRMQLERQEQALVPTLREYTPVRADPGAGPPHARATRWSCTRAR